MTIFINNVNLILKLNGKPITDKGGFHIYNYNKLLGLIKEYCKTQSNYAKHLGIGTTTLTTRLKNKTFFTQEEILKSAELFNLDKKGVIDVFFTKQ